MIEFQKITKKFKTDFWHQPLFALSDVSFTIRQEQVTGFLGANGAGKTTLIKILMGLTRCTSGQIIFNPLLGNNFKQIKSQLGFLPERPYFYPHLTGREMIYYLGQLNMMENKTIKSQLILWGEKLGIDYALDRQLKTYSKGMLQRLGLISAVIHDPHVIILDEPLSGLDPIGRKEIKDVIIDLKKQGKTIFFSSHIIPDVEEVCQNFVFLEKGQLLYQGSLDQFVRDNFNLDYDIVACFDLDLLTSDQNYLHSKIKNILHPYCYHFQVEAAEKDQLISKLIKANARIESVGASKLKLEDLFYNFRKYEKK